MNFKRYVHTSSVVLAVCLSAQAVASIALISFAVNVIASEYPWSITCPSVSFVCTIKGVIGSTEYAFCRPASIVNSTRVGASSA